MASVELFKSRNNVRRMTEAKSEPSSCILKNCVQNVGKGQVLMQEDRLVQSYSSPYDSGTCINNDLPKVVSVFESGTADIKHIFVKTALSLLHHQAAKSHNR